MWKRTLDYEDVRNNGKCKNARGIVGTASVAADPGTGNRTVYVAGARYLYALDADTGAQKWKSLVGPRGSATVVGAYYNYASPTVANGLVYEGVSSSCDAPFVRGGVQSFSQRTGRVQHSFWTVPAGQVGASVWSSVAATRNRVWTTTGDPRFTGTHRYHAYSFLRLNSRTLALRGAWQLKLPQAADLDFGSSPTLFDGSVHGVSTLLVGARQERPLLRAAPVWPEPRAGLVRAGGRRRPHESGHVPGVSCLERAGQQALSGWQRNEDPWSGLRRICPGGERGHWPTRWATGLDCGVLGTPALDAATGVLAVATWTPCPMGHPPSICSMLRPVASWASCR